MPIKFYAAAGGLALETPYNAALVNGIKALPYADRRWDAEQKRWLIATQHAQAIATLVERTIGVEVTIPQLNGPARSERRMVTVEYIGRCKARDDGSATATGYLSPDDRSIIFPEAVLRAWFEHGTQSSNHTAHAAPGTLYAVLLVHQAATPDEIKRAYRRLALQLHPDHNKEPDAGAQFQRLQAAYNVLRDDVKRRKYDAGLAFAPPPVPSRPKNSTVNRHDDDAYGYRSPLRCGRITCDGRLHVGSFLVDTILSWEDITDSQGRTLVASWPAGSDTYEVTWWQ